MLDLLAFQTKHLFSTSSVFPRIPSCPSMTILSREELIAAKYVGFSDFCGTCSSASPANKLLWVGYASTSCTVWRISCVFIVCIQTVNLLFHGRSSLCLFWLVFEYSPRPVSVTRWWLYCRQKKPLKNSTLTHCSLFLGIFFYKIKSQLQISKQSSF